MPWWTCPSRYRPAVAGIALTTLFASNGWFGAPLAAIGIKVAYTPLGIIVAMAFTSLPFIVRTVQPVLEELDPALEEAGQTLGASDLEIFLRVILPQLAPGDPGRIVAVVRAQPRRIRRDHLHRRQPAVRDGNNRPSRPSSGWREYDYPASAAIASVMLIAAFTMLAITNLLQARAPAFTR